MRDSKLMSTLDEIDLDLLLRLLRKKIFLLIFTKSFEF